MGYLIKSGILWEEGKKRGYIKYTGSGAERQIFSCDDKLLVKVRTERQKADTEERGDISYITYVMTDLNGKEVAVAKPEYADNENPAVYGWPLCHLPRVNRARVFIHRCKKKYWLVMENAGKYVLKEESGKAVMEITHRGLVGGWDIAGTEDFGCEGVCGIFLFGRFLERENEFWVV